MTIKERLQHPPTFREHRNICKCPINQLLWFGTHTIRRMVWTKVRLPKLSTNGYIVKRTASSHYVFSLMERTKMRAVKTVCKYLQSSLRSSFSVRHASYTTHEYKTRRTDSYGRHSVPGQKHGRFARSLASRYSLFLPARRRFLYPPPAAEASEPSE